MHARTTLIDRYKTVCQLCSQTVSLLTQTFATRRSTQHTTQHNTTHNNTTTMASRVATTLLLVASCLLAVAVRQGLGSEYLDVLKAEACPLSVPGCIPEINECVACDLSCSSCQRVSTNRKNLNYQSCGAEDCMTCSEGLIHVPVSKCVCVCFCVVCRAANFVCVGVCMFD